ncbi:MAG TPA: hypothetical protein VF148_10630 [Acidimicrobiia bacterium]
MGIYPPMRQPVSLGFGITQEEQMRKGQKVETLTKTVGQTPRTGVVIDLREEDLVEVEWEDGHISIVTRSALIPASGAKGRRSNPVNKQPKT